MNGRLLLAVPLLGGLIAAAVVSAVTSGAAAPVPRYAPTSPFNQRLPAPGKTPLEPNSASIVNYLLTGYGAAGFSDVTISNTPSLDTASKWDHPVYQATPTDPLYTVHETQYVGNNQGAQIRIPNGAQHALGSDAHLAVIQPDGTEQDFWKVANPNPINGGGTLTAAAGGNGGSILTGSGVCDSPSVCGFSTAALQDLAAGQIRGEEFSYGAIRHALVMVVKCDSGTHVYPAFGNGLACSNRTNAPAEGQRFQLRMSNAKVDALAIPDYRKMMLKALIHYGVYVVDTGGSPWDLQFEPGIEYPGANPLVAYAQDAGLTTGSTYTLTFNAGVDWSKFQVVAVCYTKGTC